MNQFFLKISIPLFLVLILFQNCGEFNSVSSGSNQNMSQDTIPNINDPSRKLLSPNWTIAALNRFPTSHVYFDTSVSDNSSPVRLNVQEELTPFTHLMVEDAVFVNFVKNAPQRVVLDSDPDSYDLLFLSDSGLELLAVNITANAPRIRWIEDLNQVTSSQLFSSVQVFISGQRFDVRIGATYISNAQSSMPVVSVTTVCATGTHLVVLNTCAPNPTSCPTGQHIENNMCAPDTRPCAVANGVGLQTWSASAWGMCITQSCNAGYNLTGSLCLPPPVTPSPTNPNPLNLFSVGSGFSCWTDSQNKPLCSGYNSYGKLGNSSTVDSFIPVAVRNLNSVKQISTGFEHTCAIDTQDRAFCWGRNTFGQLGNNSVLDSSVPTLVSGLTAAKQISAGIDFTCAINQQGNAFCWGRNYVGQIGNNSRIDAIIPVQLANLSGVTQITAGMNDACALDSQGRVFCWGSNAFGQLGNNTTVESLVPTQVPNLTGIKQIGSGYGHHCAIDSQDRVLCWGRNKSGQLGNNSTADSLVPLVVPGLAGIKQLSVGYAHTCAIDSQDRVLCWGNRGALDAVNPQLLSPVAVAGLSGIKKIATGYKHTCAMDSQNRVFCWGDNSYGQFGNNSTVSSTIPVPVR